MNNLSQLKSIVALAKYKHFGRAADAIGMTQSALSQNIRKVEDIFGVSLFERQNKQISLTSFGEVVNSSAQQMLEIRELARAEVRQLQNLESGTLRIGVDPYLANCILAPALADVLSEFPSLKFTVKNGVWEAMESALLREELDLYIGMAPAAKHPSVSYILHELPTPLIVCNPAHPLSGLTDVPLAKAIEYPIISPEPPDWYVKWAQRQAQSLGSTREVVQLNFLQADSIDMVKTVAARSNGLCAALPSDVQNEIDRGELKSVSLEDWPDRMEGCIASAIDRALPPAAQSLIQRYRKVVKLELKKSDEMKQVIVGGA